MLHRDIKPSNILLTAYGHPVLSDFGIAASIAVAKEEDSVGLSIPWSAPEVLLDETPGTIASEVWSLGATVYSLLAGRSPFEVPGGSNSSTDLMSRIARAKPQPVGRADVPASLLIFQMAVIGGLGRISGSVLGACIIILLPELLRPLQDYRLLLAGLLIVILMATRPQGILGKTKITNLIKK